MGEVAYGVRFRASGGDQVAGEFKQLANAQGELSNQTKESKKAAEEFIKALEWEVVTLGKSKTEVLTLKAATQDLNEAQRKHANDMITYIATKEKVAAIVDKVKASMVGMGLTVGALSAGLLYKTKVAIDTAAAMKTLSEKTGIAVETLSQLKYVADVSDTSIESLGKAMGKLPRIIGEAQAGKDSTAANALSVLGVEPAGKDRMTVFLEIATAISKIEDAEVKTAAATSIWKARGEELIPVLNLGAEGIRKLQEEGKKWSTVGSSSAEQAKAFQDNLVTLNYASGALAKTLTADLLPSVNRLIERFIVGRRAGEGFISAAFNAVRAGLGPSDLEFAQRDLVEATDAKMAAEKDLERLGSASGYTANRGRKSAQARLDAANAMIKQSLSVINFSELMGPPESAKGKSPQPNLDDFIKTKDAKDPAAKRDEGLDLIVSLENQLASAQGEASVFDATMRRLTETGKTYKEEVIYTALALAGEIDMMREAKKAADDLARAQAAALTAQADNYYNNTRAMNAANKAADTLGEQFDARGRSVAIGMIRGGPERARAQLEEEKRAARAQIDALNVTGERKRAVEESYQSWLINRNAQLVEEMKPQYEKMLDAWRDTTENMREHFDRTVVAGLQAGEGAWIKFAKTGKLEARDLLGTIGDEILRTWYRTQMAQPISGMLTAALGGISGFLFGRKDSTPIDRSGTPVPDAAPQELHAGGIAGIGGVMRTMPAALFANAPRYHNGGIAGYLQADEVPAVLKRGEKVLRVGESAGGGMVFSPTYQIDARGADASVLPRIEQAMRETESRTIAAIADMQDRGGRVGVTRGR